MRIDLIAPCGMNCRLCMAYQREKKQCKGCNSDNISKPKYCINCVIKNCSIIQSNKSKLCYECGKYPCLRLKQLDKRYRIKYHMSMIENLESIKNTNLDDFLIQEERRWKCAECGEIVNVHHNICGTCKSIHISE
jgi:RNA polymerase subunit RPABC4/transcription elongation factor Spt4